MKKKFYTNSFFTFLLISTLFTSCLSVARIKDFPKSSSAIDFDKYSSEWEQKKVPFWTAETSNEYYMEKNKEITDEKIIDIIQSAMIKQGYSIHLIDFDNKCVIGKRGFRANEWNSISGVYYKNNITNHLVQIYIKSKITQDFTGGWGENRAKKIGHLIESSID